MRLYASDADGSSVPSDDSPNATPEVKKLVSALELSTRLRDQMSDVQKGMNVRIGVFFNIYFVVVFHRNFDHLFFSRTSTRSYSETLDMLE